MKIDNDIRDALIEHVKTVSGLNMQVRGDFDMLSTKIQRMTDIPLSATTLRRFFGYQEQHGSGGCSLSTLNTICKYAGFRNVETLVACLKEEQGSSSDFVEKLIVLSSSDLVRGDKLRVTWKPDRSMVIRYEGAGEIFTVEESINGRLMAGDTFHCHQFVQGEPLYCKFVMRPNMPPVDYVCGRNSGVRFEVIAK